VLGAASPRHHSRESSSVGRSFLGKPGELAAGIAQACPAVRKERHLDPGRLAAECEAFRESPYSKGFQSGLLSPILNAVRPAAFTLVNSKTKRTLKSLAVVTCRTELICFPESNAVLLSIVEELGAGPSPGRSGRRAARATCLMHSATVGVSIQGRRKTGGWGFGRSRWYGRRRCDGAFFSDGAERPAYV